MTRSVRWIALIGAFALTARIAAAQTGGGYDLSWHTVDNAGGVIFATGGNYTLGATIGQAEAGSASGGAYSLTGGFWFDPTLRVYLPVARR